MLTKKAPAKINLGLHVLRRRTDGYHDIETVILRLPWSDVLQAEPADELSMSCSDPTLPTDAGNLVMKAASSLRKRREAKMAGARFHLEKHIPQGAGLGGGSSDAAAALMLLNDLWALGLDEAQLAQHALEIGSDVPSFLGPPTAFATGRGERLEPLIDPDTDESYRPTFRIVVAVPEEEISTADAYAMITPRMMPREAAEPEVPAPDLRKIVLSKNLARWRNELTNDFEAPVFAARPAIAALKEAMVAAGAGYAAMSGTGSAVFGFFEEGDAAAAAAEALRQSGHRTWFGTV